MGLAPRLFFRLLSLHSRREDAGIRAANLTPIAQGSVVSLNSAAVGLR